MRYPSLAILIFSLSCASAKVYDSQGKVIQSCFTWGQARCSFTCESVQVENITIPNTENSCMEISSGGLSENGADAIVESATGIPAAIIKAIIPGP